MIGIFILKKIRDHSSARNNGKKEVPQAKDYQEPPKSENRKDTSVESAWPCQHLNFGFIASRIVREKKPISEGPRTAVHGNWAWPDR